VGVDAPQPPHREPAAGLSTTAKIGVAVFVAVLYAVGMSVAGEVLPGVVGGVLAGVVCFLVLREYERQRRERHQRR
jgi:hypothetical protein